MEAMSLYKVFPSQYLLRNILILIIINLSMFVMHIFDILYFYPTAQNYHYHDNIFLK